MVLEELEVSLEFAREGEVGALIQALSLKSALFSAFW
jgi:hypothetical protein